MYELADDGSNHYRVRLPQETLRAKGFDAEYCQTGGESRDADVIYFNRPASRKAVEVIAKLVSDGYAVVVDVDDLFSHVRQGHSMYGERADQTHRLVKWACNLATMVTASTPGVLDAYAAPEKGRVIPNFVPEIYLTVKPDLTRIPEVLRVGWTGTVASHPHDLQVTDGAVARTAWERGWQVAAIGPREQAEAVRRALKMLRRQSLRTTGWLSLADYPQAVASLSVGVVPLEDCLFNDAKSWLKGLEFAALGVPFVASPSAEYVKLRLRGIGFTASRPNKWRSELSALMRNDAYRTEEALANRALAAALTIERHAHVWAEVFEEAARRRTRVLT